MHLFDAEAGYLLIMKKRPPPKDCFHLGISPLPRPTQHYRSNRRHVQSVTSCGVVSGRCPSRRPVHPFIACLVGGNYNEGMGVGVVWDVNSLVWLEAMGVEYGRGKGI